MTAISNDFINIIKGFHGIILKVSNTVSNPQKTFKMSK